MGTTGIFEASGSSWESIAETTLLVVVDRIQGVRLRSGANSEETSFLATAFYSSEQQPVRDARRTLLCSAGVGIATSTDCNSGCKITLPLNHREQFVKVAVFGAGSGDA